MRSIEQGLGRRLIGERTLQRKIYRFPRGFLRAFFGAARPDFVCFLVGFLAAFARVACAPFFAVRPGFAFLVAGPAFDMISWRLGRLSVEHQARTSQISPGPYSRRC